MGSKPLFLGVYLAPGVFIGSDLALYRAYLEHVRTMAKPKTGEAHQIVRAWVMIQWRMQCLAELEQEWWLAFEQGSFDPELEVEETLLAGMAEDRMRACQRAINSWDRLQRMERRLQKEAGRLLPLLGALIAEAMTLGQPSSNKNSEDSGAVGESLNRASSDVTSDAIICASVAVGESSNRASIELTPDAIICAERRQNCFDQNTPTPIAHGVWGVAPSAGNLRGATPLSRGIRGTASPVKRSDSVPNLGEKPS